jgi:hypothetical protein
MREHNTSDSVIIQNAPTGRERFGHGSLEEVPILDLAVKGLGFILDGFQTTVVKPLSSHSQGSPRPAMEKICQIGIGNRVVVGWVGIGNSEGIGLDRQLEQLGIAVEGPGGLNDPEQSKVVFR